MPVNHGRPPREQDRGPYLRFTPLAARPHAAITGDVCMSKDVGRLRLRARGGEWE